MEVVDLVGSLGVAILLLAFFLNLIGKIKQNSWVYLFMNALGAGLACLASVLLHYLPFIILEGCWMLVSLVGLGKIFWVKR